MLKIIVALIVCLSVIEVMIEHFTIGCYRPMTTWLIGGQFVMAFWLCEWDMLCAVLMGLPSITMLVLFCISQPKTKSESQEGGHSHVT